MYAIIKSPKTLTSRMRYTVKTFKTADAMHKFLNKQPNNDWRSTQNDEPIKSGTYAYAGGQYHNVKSLDPSVLSHI